MNSKFKLNPLEEINKISETAIKEICKISLEEAQKSIYSPTAAYDRIKDKVIMKLDKLIKEGDA